MPPRRKRQPKSKALSTIAKALTRKTRRKKRATLSYKSSIPSFLPVHKYITFKWCSKMITHTATTTDMAINPFRLTTIANPDVGGIYTGDAPLGFSQAIQFYSRYVVYAASVKVHIYQTGSNYIVAMGPSFSTTLPTGYTDIHNLLEDARFIKKRIASGETRLQTLSRKYDLPAIKGVSRKDYMGDDIHQVQISNVTQGANTSDPWSYTETAPSSLQYFIIANQGSDESTSSTVRYSVEITYKTKWFRPREIYTS